MIAKEKMGFSFGDTSKFNQLLVCDSVRGADSTGVFGVDKLGNADYLKQKGDPFLLINTPEYREFNNNMFQNYRFVIGHNRKATIGTVSDETAHPFQEGNIVLVHNGTLLNHKDITDEEVTVDSHAITHAISLKGYKDTLKELQGAFTLVWYDATDKCLRFVRNDQRPLHIIETKTLYLLSSEATLAEWIAGRDMTAKEQLTTTTVKSGIVYSINLDDTTKINEEKIEFYKPPKPKVTQLPAVPVKKITGVQQKNGWAGYECAPGDFIVVTITDLIDRMDKDNKYTAILKGQRIFKNQAPVYIFVTQDELDLYTEVGESVFTCCVDRITYVDKDPDPVRIYAKQLDIYEPIYDVTGNEIS